MTDKDIVQQWTDDQHDVWNHRAKVYMSLDWVKKNDFIQSLVEFCAPKPDAVALDIGTGPGVIAKELAPHVDRVIGIDLSEEMITRASAEHQDISNLSFDVGDVHNLQFDDESFDLCVGRMVFHHVADCDAGVQEMHRVLKPGGMAVICEGVPPDHLTRERYEEIFAIKEKRHTFSEAELINLLDRNGFGDILLKPFFMRQVSLNNWLGGSGLPDKSIEEIKQLHIEADDHFKDIYNLTERDGDVFMDWKFIMVRGVPLR